VKRIFFLLLATAFAVSSRPARAADATAELKALVGKIRDDMAAGRTNAADLADDLKQFDRLLAEHQGEKTDAAANLLYMKAMLYDEGLHDSAKAAELIQQLKADFAGTDFVDELERREAAEAAAAKIQASLAVGTAFPGFTIKNLAGQSLSLTNFAGKVVLIDFWATSSRSCLAELSYVLAAYEKYHARGFEIIGISLDPDPAKLAEFVREMKMPWPEFCDGHGWQGQLAVKYGVEKIPATYLLDGHGIILAKDLHGDALSTAVARALGIH